MFGEIADFLPRMVPLLLGAVCLIPHAASPLPTSSVMARRPCLLAASQAGRPVAPEGLPARLPPSTPQVPANRPGVLLAVLLALYVSNQWARSLPSYLVSFDAVAMQAAGAGHRLLNVGLGFNQAQRHTNKTTTIVDFTAISTTVRPLHTRRSMACSFRTVSRCCTLPSPSPPATPATASRAHACSSPRRSRGRRRRRRRAWHAVSRTCCSRVCS